MGSAKTRFSISNDRPTAIKADGLIIPVFKKPGENNTDKTKAGQKNEQPAYASIQWPVSLDKTLLNEIEAIANDEKFDGSKGKTLTLRQSATNKLGPRRLILVGLGEEAKVKPRHWESNALKAVASLLGLKDLQAVAILLPSTQALSSEAAICLAVDAVFQATYKSMEAKDAPVGLQKVILLIEEKANSLNATLQQAEALASARSFVKDLVNHPSNLKTTNTLVEEAKKIGKNPSITLNLETSAKWIEQNMPCFFTVAKGSLASDPPKFIQLHYKPKTGKAKKHIAIVGKSVIFDTGGYQVKPGDYMVTMKGDMTGGAVALATMRAIAELQPQNIAVSVYLAATPNKIDSDAMIPDSIVNTTCGKKVEIRHTDAEGRLTLIDAVTQAAQKKPAEIITIATLTGSASQAVGYYIALMGNNEDLIQRVTQAGRSQAEPIQTLDVTEDDYENIKSKLDGADIINTSQRKHRGAQTAAAFVMSGAPEDMPMAHLDIAGADMTPDEKATGTSVKTIVQYLLNQDAKQSSSVPVSKAPAPKAPSMKATVATPVRGKKAPAKTATAVKTAKPVAASPAKRKAAIAAKPAAKATVKPAPKAVAKPGPKAKPVVKATPKRGTTAKATAVKPATKAKPTKAAPKTKTGAKKAAPPKGKGPKKGK